MTEREPDIDTALKWLICVAEGDREGLTFNAWSALNAAAIRREIARLRTGRWAGSREAAAKVAQAMEELIALAETTFPEADLLDARIALDEWRALLPSVGEGQAQP